jgi:hypothetical protein
MEEERNPFVEIELGYNGGRIVFFDPQEAVEWVKKEFSYWEWLADAVRNDSQTIQIQSELRKRLEKIQPNIIQSSSSESLKQRILEAYGKENLLHSTNVKVKFIDELKAEDSAEAAYALAYFLGMNLNFRTNITSSSPANFKYLKGSFKAFIHEKGIGSNVEPEKLALQELKSNWQNHFQSQAGEIQNNIGVSRNLISETKSELEQLKEGFKKIIEGSKSELEALTDTYDNKMTLFKPVEYWNRKKHTHLGLAITFGVMLLASLVLGGFWIHNTILNTTIIKATKLYETTLYNIAMPILVITLLFWAVRILVRLFLSNIHLLNESAEKAVMTKVYLAMLRDQSIKKEDLSLVLQALFRHSSTGIVKDDASPNTTLELLTKIITGSK